MKQRIGIGVLDWGLGHATRMVPVADALRGLGADVVWLTSGRSGQWLRQRFQQDEHHTLPAAEIRYGRSAFWSVVRMMPVLARAEEHEHRWLSAHLAALRLDGMISDNRYGLHAPGLPAVLVTHQLAPKAPYGLGCLNGRIARIMARKLRLFDQVWVPDVPGPDSLAGSLATNPFFRGTLRHLGWLSRFENISTDTPTVASYALVGLVSGPENQRTLFERALLAAFKKDGRPSLLVCGRADEPMDVQIENVRMVHHLDDAPLAAALTHAEKIYCRAGYSTLMDLRVLGLTAELSATPGQTEQQYLVGRHRVLHTHAQTPNEQLGFVLKEWIQMLPHK